MKVSTKARDEILVKLARGLGSELCLCDQGVLVAHCLLEDEQDIQEQREKTRKLIRDKHHSRSSLALPSLKKECLFVGTISPPSDSTWSEEVPAPWDSPAWGFGVEGWLDKGREGPALISLCTSSLEVAESLAKVEARLERICECKSKSTL